jgi:glutathione S-transferase
MKFIDSFGPNPRMVRMFMAEKGIELPKTELDILAGENRQAPYTDKNPNGEMPALELEDGSVLAETGAICEYLEEKYPTPNILGDTAEKRAQGRMWMRRVELGITENIYNGFRYSEGLELFKDRRFCIPEAAEGLKAKAQVKLKWLDDLIAGNDYIGGDQSGLADLALYCCLDFAQGVGQPLNPELKNITAWFARMDALPSAKSSLHPASAEAGMKG